MYVRPMARENIDIDRDIERLVIDVDQRRGVADRVVLALVAGVERPRREV